MGLVKSVYSGSYENDRALWARALAEAGYVLVAGSFSEGATLSSKYEAVWDSVGGGCYRWTGTFPKTVAATSSPSDDASFVKVTTESTLRNDALTVVPASRFGVTGDGVACGEACVAAITYIMNNGGTLQFPKGEVNWGTTRATFPIYNGPEFKIIGADGGTKFTFDDTPPYASGVSWPYTEGTKIVIGGTPSTPGLYVAPFTLSGIDFDYSRQVNKGGPTLATMAAGAHPTPYSDGALILRVMYADTPILENINISNVYGSGLQVWKCTDATIRNVNCTDVSANQVLGANNNESVDHFGYGIWSGASANTLIQRCRAWNTRVFECDDSLVAPNNGAKYNGTICGYIGIYCEYAPEQGDVGRYPPRYSWTGDTSLTPIQLRGYGRVEDCTVSGYTLNYKSESALSIQFINCVSLNHYIGFSMQSSGLLSACYANALGVANNVCPQNGFEAQRADYHLSWWSASTNTHDLLMTGCHAVTTKYQSVAVGKGSPIIESNVFDISKSARVLNSVTSFQVGILDFNKNIIRADSNLVTSSGHIRVTNTHMPNVKGNKIYNASSVRFSVSLQRGNFNENLVEGPLNLYFSGPVHCGKNLLRDGATYTTPAITYYQASDGVFEDNDVYVYDAADAQAQLVLLSSTTNFKGLNNRVHVTAATGTRAASIPVFKTYGQCLYTDISDNTVSGDSASAYPWNLFNGVSGALVFTCKNNRTDNATVTLLTGLYSQKAPWRLEGNDWTQTFTAEINTEANLYASYKAVLGEKIPYIRPVAGGAEGIVKTSSGWKTYGSVAA